MGFYYLTEQLKGFSKKQLIRMVQELKAELDENKWISVKDELPKREVESRCDVSVIGCVLNKDNNSLFIAEVTYCDCGVNSYWEWQNEEEVLETEYEILYWMPFPKPPSEE